MELSPQLAAERLLLCRIEGPRVLERAALDTFRYPSAASTGADPPYDRSSVYVPVPAYE